MGKVAFVVAPNYSYDLLLACLKFEGERPRRVPQQVQQVESTDAEDEDLLEDAIQEVVENDNEEGIVDENWQQGDALIFERASNPFSSYRLVNPIIDMEGAAFSSAKYFIHFLPCNHLKSVVIPVISNYATTHVPSWIDLYWPEYLTWVILWITMTVINCRDINVY
ncbi:hypothetical protein HPULCUR_011621 [Helicostylum pulchrum]|uniref:Uncharacterized protein n=1 Tax=Helicostylum pulchrum TaxID=562976 RepID=A0ABP9YHM2_9FUNG